MVAVQVHVLLPVGAGVPVQPRLAQNKLLPVQGAAAVVAATAAGQVEFLLGAHLGHLPVCAGKERGKAVVLALLPFVLARASVPTRAPFRHYCVSGPLFGAHLCLLSVCVGEEKGKAVVLALVAFCFSSCFRSYLCTFQT